MKLNQVMLAKLLLPIGFMFAAGVIAAGMLEWPLAVNYGLTALMFAAFFGALG